MAPARRSSFSLVYTGILLAMVLLPDFLRAGPVRQQQHEEVSAVSSEGRGHQGGVARSRRSLMLPQFKRMPDFWVWYKYFMETGNQEGVEDLDRMYRNYLHNKHRSEEGPTFNHYLTHLSEIYKACADSDDPECIAESTSKPKAKTVMPANVKAASVAVCNPFYDPYCLYPMLPKGVSAAPEPAPAPAKAPAPILTPLLPVPLKSPSGYFYYAPVLEPFLSAEQKAELLRICNPADVECLQYHLRAAYGYRPAPPGPLPSYSALGCDPAKDPYCKPLLVKKAPSGYFHLYPTCDPEVDPLCVSNVAAPVPAATSEEQPPAPAAKEQHCNPLFDEGCNPLTAAKLAGLTKPVLEYPPPKAAPQPAPFALACDPRYDPYCLFRGAAAALRRPPQLLPQYEVRSRLGVQGKTKEGYDCYVHYDQGCTPLEAGDDAEAAAPPAGPGPAPAGPACHPYDPSCGTFSPAGAPSVAAKDGVIEPDPHCDPEIDYNCRLRRAGPAPVAAADEPARQGEEPQQEAAAEPHPYAVPRFEDFLRGYMSQYKK